ncbi:uncharacterized protein E0L32_003343 [Thyridium curvatum]|uniref:Mediator of RNA polymerase II transcription subunit 8 n=1 Tax=Thyridium curvatum TaxID=1093900 RepID=A0A507B277_9PEZI|nr:uncharacterized protein E0L32_003343 [Thyridium curvatum]TPX17225.1 hypothetical protein E0L32_003343 [Thyridium curvatum]
MMKGVGGPTPGAAPSRHHLGAPKSIDQPQPLFVFSVHHPNDAASRPSRRGSVQLTIMASLNLTQDELKALESTRGRLSQLSNSIASLKNDILHSHPLPNPSSLQASAYILQQNMASLLEVYSQHADLFQRVAVHPSTNYPGRTQEGILMQLLRKKLEPDVEDSVDGARSAALAAGIGPESFAGRSGGKQGAAGGNHNYDSDEDDEDEDEDEEDSEDDENAPREPAGLGEVWASAREVCVERVTQYVTEEGNDVYTKEERERGVENVRTGLRRNLDEESEDEDDDDDEDEDEEMADAGAAGIAPGGAPQQQQGPEAAAKMVPPQPELMMWFAARGDTNIPPYIEVEARKEQGPKPGLR